MAWSVNAVSSYWFWIISPFIWLLSFLICPFNATSLSGPTSMLEKTPVILTCDHSSGHIVKWTRNGQLFIRCSRYSCTKQIGYSAMIGETSSVLKIAAVTLADNCWKCSVNGESPEFCLNILKPALSMVLTGAKAGAKQLTGKIECSNPYYRDVVCYYETTSGNLKFDQVITKPVSNCTPEFLRSTLITVDISTQRLSPGNFTVYCEATFNASNQKVISNNVTFEIPASIFLFGPTFALEKTPFILTCVHTGNTNSQWFKNGKSFMSCSHVSCPPRPGYSASLTNFSLALQVTSADVSDQCWRCRIDGLQSYEHCLDIVTFPQIHINGSIIIREHKQLNINCSASGNPTPTLFKWIFENGSESQRLMIDNVTRHNAGNYTCTAISKTPHFGYLTTRQTVEIKVLYPPDVKVENINITAGKRAEIKCIVNGIPSNYTFHKWQQKWQNHILHEFGNDSALVLTYPSYQDMGTWVCRVHNGIRGLDGELVHSGSTTFMVNGPPVFGKNINFAIASKGQNITLILEFFSYPKFTNLVWSMETESFKTFSFIKSKVTLNIYGHEIESDGYKSVLHLKNLTIYNFKKEYELNVSNDFGSTVEAVTLYEIEKQYIMVQRSGQPGKPAGTFWGYVLCCHAVLFLLEKHINSLI